MITFNNRENNRYAFAPSNDQNYHNNFLNSYQMNPSFGVGLNISYQNYEMDHDRGRFLRKSYGNELLNQMKENERRREIERKKRQEEELKEEMRLQRERDMLEMKARDEEERRRKELEQRRKENERIISSYSVMSHPKSRPLPQTDEEGKKTTEDLLKEMRELKRREYQLFHETTQANLEKIRHYLLQQSNRISGVINNLRDENMHSNLYLVDIGKELKELEQELKLKSIQENFEKDYMYSSLIETNKKRNAMDEYFGIGKWKENAEKLPYLNRSQNIVSLRDNLNLENRWYIDPEDKIIREINKKYYKDKMNLNQILIQNQERLKMLNKRQSLKYL